MDLDQKSDQIIWI